MRPVLLRWYRLIGPLGLTAMGLTILGVAMMVLSILITGKLQANSGTVVQFAALFVGVVFAVVKMVSAGVTYRRTSATPSHQDVLIPLLRSTREYCLVLRPFGKDGEIIVPTAARQRQKDGRDDAPAGRSRLRPGPAWLTPNTTIEQVVADAARQALNTETYGIVDQSVLFAPPGPTFMRASNEDWRKVAHWLIRRAHSIVLIVPPGQEMRDGFAWEIEQIVRYGMQSRVVIVLPPCDQEPFAHQEALGQVAVLLALLEGSGTLAGLNHFRAHEHELQLTPNTLLVKQTEQLGPRTWFAVRSEAEPAASRRTRRAEPRVSDSTYLTCLVEAFRETEHELTELDFKQRYPSTWEKGSPGPVSVGD